MIDRKAVITRNNIVHQDVDTANPLSVGNGNLSFTVDVTGVQSLKDLYDDIPLCTMSSWGWHSTPFTEQNPYPSHDELIPEMIFSGGRTVPYYTDRSAQEPLYDWLRQNPHRFNLLSLGFFDQRSGGSLDVKDLSVVRQELDLWEGIITSEFLYREVSVQVRTACDPEYDVIALDVQGLKEAELGITLKLPLPGSGLNGEEESEAEHVHAQTETFVCASGAVKIRRSIDQDAYEIRLRGSGYSLEVSDDQEVLCIPNSDVLQLAVKLRSTDEEITESGLSTCDVLSRTKEYWAAFWDQSAAIDFSKSVDKRAPELERRIVLSRYLMATQCSGTIPPQETGLTCNSWYGKFHLEMHYWHVVHFLQWGHVDLFKRSVNWYPQNLQAARDLAASQGFKGARWPKMTDPAGYDAPSFIGPLLIWQQPHPIIYAELLFQYDEDPKRVLDEWGSIVDESIAFIRDYLRWEDGHWHLGPGLIPAQESHAPGDTLDPTLELQYVDLALRIADKWDVRRGIKGTDHEETRLLLAPLPLVLRDEPETYSAHKLAEDTYTVHNTDHPSMLGALGWLDGSMADTEIMNNTLNKVLSSWQFDTAWGWDFPVMAMTAGRLGKLGLALDCLLMDEPKNTYRKNGHNDQVGKAELPIYLPGNGALLHGVATLFATKGKSTRTFVLDKWHIEVEGLLMLPY